MPPAVDLATVLPCVRPRHSSADLADSPTCGAGEERDDPAIPLPDSSGYGLQKPEVAIEPIGTSGNLKHAARYARMTAGRRRTRVAPAGIKGGLHFLHGYDGARNGPSRGRGRGRWARGWLITDRSSTCRRCQHPRRPRSALFVSPDDRDHNCHGDEQGDEDARRQCAALEESLQAALFEFCAHHVGGTCVLFVSSATVITRT